MRKLGKMKAIHQQYDTIFITELATIGLRLEGARLTRLVYLLKAPSKTSEDAHVKRAQSVIEKYLKSTSKLKTLKIDFQLDVSAFQKSVLDQLLLIPYGETRTYGEIAKVLKTSARAVGNACRHNPVPLIIPCHRVVSAKDIGGYDGAKSGDLLAIKYKLLDREGVSFSS
jgi:methylated-DNA-[protein]-cysteine S-methyltransferase